MISRNQSLACVRPQSYRFKKWTGSSWAVFNSIKRPIEIGFLSVAISASLGVKARGIHKLNRKTVQERLAATGCRKTIALDEQEWSCLYLLLSNLTTTAALKGEIASGKLPLRYLLYCPSDVPYTSLQVFVYFHFFEHACSPFGSNDPLRRWPILSYHHFSALPSISQ